MIPARLSTWRAVLRTLALVVAFALVTPAPARAESVTATFSKAQKSLKDGKTKVAYKMLLGIIRRYPDHEPSHLLLGHILFRSGQVAKAYKHFKRVSPDLVSPDLGYEYGITMFQGKNCGKAIQGFARVPSASKLADTANFYRGICYVRSRQYQRAQYYLTRARDIPSNLVSSRRQALALAKNYARNERGGGGSGSAPNPYLIVPTPPPVPAGYDPYAAATPPAEPPKDGKEAVPAPPKKPEKPPPPVTGFVNAVTPSLTITQLTTTDDFFGYKTTQVDTRTTEMKLGFKSKYLAAPRPAGGQPYASFGLDLGQVNVNASGNSTSYIAYSDDPGTIIEQQAPTPSASVHNGTLAANPEFFYPPSGAVDLTAGFKYNETYPDVKADKKTGTNGPYASVGLNGDAGTAKFTGSQSTAQGAEGKPLFTETKLILELGKDFETTSLDFTVTQATTEQAQKPPPGPVSLGAVNTFDGTTQIILASVTKTWDSTSLTASVTNTTYTPSNAQYFKTAEDTNMKAAVSGNRTFDFGGTATITMSMANLGAYKVMVEDKTQPAGEDGKFPKTAVKTEATEQAAFASFKLTPVDWAFALASYKYAKYADTFNDATPIEQQAAFQQAVTETHTELTLQVGLTKTF